MIKTIKADGSEKEFLAGMKKRSSEVNAEVEKTVRAIIDDVAARGDEAVKEYTARFDCPDMQYYRVPDEVIQDALTNADPDFVNSMLNAQENITAFHTRQKQNGYMMTDESGCILGQRVRGLDRVGLYVPGGTAAYPSSVLMNAIPAKIAGVGEIIMVTPPMKDGTPNNDILVAAALCGVDKIFMCGGAQAVAALAFGTEEIPKVSKIVGPGNIFVATAKKLLYGTVDIDMIAGPSEILIVADDTANPKYAAADLMSQAEHDKLASSVLITTSQRVADETVKEIERQVADLSRKDIINTSLEHFGIMDIIEILIKKSKCLFIKIHIGHMNRNFINIVIIVKILCSLFSENNCTVNIEEPICSGYFVKGAKSIKLRTVGTNPFKERGFDNVLICSAVENCGVYIKTSVKLRHLRILTV